MSKDFRLRMPEGLDLAGSPLMDDDEDEGAAPAVVRPRAATTRSTTPAPSLRRLSTDKASVRTARVVKPSQTVVGPSRPKISAPVQVDASNPFLDEWESSAGEDESDRSAQSPVRTATTARRSKRQRASLFVLTKQYESILEWTEKARYTSAEQVAVYLNLSPRKAVRLLDRLVDQGFTDKKVQPGSSPAYFLSEVGKQYVGSDTKKVDTSTGMGLVPHTLEVGWLMLTLLKRGSALTPMVEKAFGRPVELSDFVTESELKRALNARVSQLKSAAEEVSFRETGFRKQALRWEGWSDLYDLAFSRAATGSKPRPDQLTTLAVWNLGADRGYGMPHCPDLMLWTGKRALAFEIELSRKPKSAEDIVQAYGTPDASPFDRVIWFCGKQSVQHAVEETVGTYSESAFVRSQSGNSDSKIGEMKSHLEDELRRAQQAHPIRPERVANLKRQLAELGESSQTRAVARDEAEAADDAASAAVQKFHTVQLTTPLTAFRTRQLAALNDEEAASQKANRAARDRGMWHVNGSGKALPCRCGVTCMAAHGQFPTEQDARDFAEEVA